MLLVESPKHPAASSKTFPLASAATKAPSEKVAGVRRVLQWGVQGAAAAVVVVVVAAVVAMFGRNM